MSNIQKFDTVNSKSFIGKCFADYDLIRFSKIEVISQFLSLSFLFISLSDKNCEMHSALNPPHELDSQIKSPIYKKTSDTKNTGIYLFKRNCCLVYQTENTKNLDS